MSGKTQSLSLFSAPYITHSGLLDTRVYHHLLQVFNEHLRLPLSTPTKDAQSLLAPKSPVQRDICHWSFYYYYPPSIDTCLATRQCSNVA